jgi:RNA polymerase sigma-70 factor (ECF subfamily)
MNRGMTDDCEARFAVLFRSHHMAVRHFVTRRAWPDAVDDVVADTFLVAWRRLEEVPADPLPWLLRTARNCLSNHRRGALRGAALLERLRVEHAGSSGDEHDVTAQRESILRALGRLSDDERELIMLTEWDGLTPARVAATLGGTSAQVRARSYRARRKLRRALEAELATRSALPTARSLHDVC